MNDFWLWIERLAHLYIVYMAFSNIVPKMIKYWIGIPTPRRKENNNDVFADDDDEVIIEKTPTTEVEGTLNNILKYLFDLLKMHVDQGNLLPAARKHKKNAPKKIKDI